MKKFLLANILCIALLAALLAACSNGEDFLYDEEQSTFIEVSAEMAYSFDSGSTRLKSDTLSPEDTLIFIANILPSKSIKIKRYLWTMDDEIISYDFSFRRNIDTPGPHRIVFLLETYLGDTLSDTLLLQVSNPPVLDREKFIPAARSQGIPTSGGVSFAWNAHDPDSIASLHYRFTIEGIVDTIVADQAFTYWGNLPPLEHLFWSVEAINEFGFTSREAIHGDFFTRGGVGETGFTGAITTSAAAHSITFFDFDVNATVLDTLGNAVLEKTFKGSLNVEKFALSPLAAGKYRIAFDVPEYPDFTCDTLDVTLRDNEVFDLDTLTLRDTTPPQISAIAAGIVINDTDTLDYSDTLRFYIRDFGTLRSQKIATAYLESVQLTTTAVMGDTFAVVIPQKMRTWNRRQLDIVATDASKNKTVRNYTLEGSESWFKTNPDPTVVTGDSIRLYIIDNNHYGFKPDSFYFDTGRRLIAIDAGGIPLCSQTLIAVEFNKGDNVVRSGIRYTNGITQWKKWTLTRDNPTGGTP